MKNSNTTNKETSREQKELQKILNEVERLYKKHIKEGYDYGGIVFEDWTDGNEIHEVLIFEKE